VRGGGEAERHFIGATMNQSFPILLDYPAQSGAWATGPLPREFSLGPLQFSNADQFPLSEMYCHIDEDEIVLRMNAEFGTSSAWRGLSMVVFFMHRLPEGWERFEEEVAGYQEDAKATVKLPEKQPFDETSLALSDVPPGWEHDCFACANRNLFHVYTSDRAAVMIRWYAKKGTMLDHPLLSLVQQNVRLDNDRWVAELPQSLLAVNAQPDDAEEDGDREIERKLDLRAEKAAIQEYIASRVAGFDPETNYGPGEGQTISAIDLGYDFVQGGWVALIFDTRDESEPDGSWTTFLDDDNLLYRSWPELADAIFDEQAVTVTLLDGTQRNFSGSDDLDTAGELLGQLMHDLLLEARDTGLLGTLPTAEKCYLGVEDFNGAYGWPDYEKRESEGRL
jgi:hypothetical protein